MEFCRWPSRRKNAIRRSPRRLVTPRRSTLELERLEDRTLPSFAAGGIFPTGANPRAVVTADFNGDGRLDLAIADKDSNSVSILLGNGNGTFGSQLTFAAGTGPVSLAVGDFNGDGKLDLA